MTNATRKYKAPLINCRNCKRLGINWNYEEKKNKYFCAIYGNVFMSNCIRKVEKEVKI